MDNYWEILLSKWREKGRDGFTIPYLLGSQNYLPLSEEHHDISELITNIAYGNYKIYISYCMDINDIILGIYEGEKQKIAGKFIVQNGFETSLFLTKFLSDLGDNLESIIDSLNHKYHEDIAAKSYSRNNEKLGDFSVEEINFIKSCFELL